MPPLDPAKQRSFWRSMDELADSPEFRKFVEREFPGLAEGALPPASRRHFLKIMGASLALAGATGCRWPKEEIAPFAHRPDGYVPGEAVRYATAMDLHGAATGLLVTSYDGRPIKIEGNPEQWQSLGGTNSWHQASILELYDPERSQNAVEKETGARRPEDFVAFSRSHFDALKAAGGRKMAILAEPSSSPSRIDMRARLMQAFPQAKWYEYTPLSRENLREGSKLALGGAYRTHVALDRAETIVSLDEDLLLHHPAAVRYARDFVNGRDPDAERFSRLYAVESCFSLTGSVADRRIALPNRLIPVLAVALAAELFLELGLPLPPDSENLKRILERVQVHPLYTDAQIDFSFARDLFRNRGRSVVVAGPRQPVEVHALVHVINEALGNIGNTVTYTAEPDPDHLSGAAALRELVRDASRGFLDSLVILGGNPVYDAPADIDVAGALGRAKTSIHLSLYRNETSQLCSWHVPRAHFLETWGDARDFRGTLSVTQPLIQPLFDGKSDIELLALITGEPPFTGYEIVRRTFLAAAQDGGPAATEEDWARTLHDGQRAGTEWPTARPAVRTDAWADRLKPFLTVSKDRQDGRFELVFMEDSSLIDGRYANNGWLQELPDPLTMLTWDNAALVSPPDAEALDVGQEEMIRVTLGETSLDLPVFLMPGQAPGTIGISLGYGRTAAGGVGDGKGFNVYPFRSAANPGWAEVEVQKAAGSYRLATTQNHFAIDTLGGRERAERAGTLAREIELADYRADPEHAADHGHHYEPVELYQNWKSDGHKWGMAIDLNTCIGCNVCMVACQAENNVPVVGKQEVLMGREMHWIRVDRYFTGDPLDPLVAHQPVNCQHCENAPCEQVCPVAATVHDSEGLNLMVYNRCVGTRYCANNCPYKVRRFNYFNNHKDEDALTKMIYNPEVTVRFRGVMEKCTYCIQRIQNTKIRAKNEGRAIRDGEFTSACAQACPTGAITFGDLNDKESQVARKHADPRAYTMLEETNVRPRNRFLVRVRNRGTGSGHDGAA